MERLTKVLLSAGVFLCLASTGSGFRCERENIWGLTQIFYCPEAGDDPSEQYCCGFGDNKYCCSTPTDEEIIEEFFEKASASLPLPLAQVKPDPMVPGTTKQRAIAKLNDTVRATKDKVKTAIGGKAMSAKDKLKAKINSTVSIAKDKVKQKIKDKVKEKATKKLDPTGGQ